MPRKRFFPKLRRWLNFDYYLREIKNRLRKKLDKILRTDTYEASLDNLIYQLADLIQQGKLPIIPRIATSNETVDRLIHSEMSLSRFGDGEFKIMFQEGNIGFQHNDPVLVRRLKEVLQSQVPNLMIALPRTFGYLPGIFGHLSDEIKFWRPFMGKLRPHIDPYLSGSTQYWDASVTRNMTDPDHFEKIKQIWQGKDIVTIEGSMCRLGVGNDLFKTAGSVRRILAPAENAFRCYAQLLEEAFKQNKNVLFLIALGPTASILAYDLAVAGFRALDIGHLDICYELFLRQKDKMVPIEGKYVNEVSYRNPVECKDKNYLEQILAEIK